MADKYLPIQVNHSRVYKYQSELWGTPRESEVRGTHCLNYMSFSKWEGQSTDQWLQRTGGRGENDYKGNGRIWGGDRTWLWGWFTQMYLSKHKELYLKMLNLLYVNCTFKKWKKKAIGKN